MDGVAPANVPTARIPAAAFAVIAAGVGAALHLGKLPPAVPALQATFGIGLVEAGFMLSLVQAAGMTLGLLVGLAADTIGLRRSMLIGLLVVTLASIGGGCVTPGPYALPLLMVLRALEGLGFLLTVMPAPGLIRAVVPAGLEKLAMGFWGAYMPLGVALALLLGPMLIASMGWQGWWWALSAVSACACVWVWRSVPADRAIAAVVAVGAQGGPRWTSRLGETLRAAGPRRVSLAFAVYSSQWIAVIGFLPAIYAEVGVPAGWNAVLTALAAAMNIIGNLVGGRLLQRGVEPAFVLRFGFGTMAVAGIVAFAQWGHGVDAVVLPPAVRYAAVCLFSLSGGVVPATLFMLAVRVAPSPTTISTTVGMMQQASALGQFLAPPVVAWLAHRVGGWQWTWAVTLACSVVGIVLAARLGSPRTSMGAA
ncbi:MAG: MFS transporter [Variovorax sp.]|nr:MFS transporter [Variovorax sp.]